MTAIEVCRTAVLDGHLEQCDHCGHQRNAYNSCGDRHCPKCQSFARFKWLQERQAELLSHCRYLMMKSTVLGCRSNCGGRAWPGQPQEHCSHAVHREHSLRDRSCPPTPPEGLPSSPQSRTLTASGSFRSTPEIQLAINTHRSRSGRRLCPINF
jgi:hypothetical protein